MTEFKTGQKWISNAEPELGVGRIIKVEHRFVTIQFNLVEENRVYAIQQAPISRVRFRVGDTVRTVDGVELVVDDVGERDGILVYTGDYNGTRTSLIESDLDPNIIFSSPEERLFTHQLDTNQRFVLRYQTLQAIAAQATSQVRGLIGPRVALIPHQFYIAAEVAGRHAPRVLLADEVGLGKTIEAGLIIHQQLVTGRAQRVLIIVPQALTFQWFVEMIRRFNLQFTIMDEERCELIESDISTESIEDNDFDNPFDAQQLMLCSINLFTDNPLRLEQALAAEWDLIVVDEAHHLSWQDETPGEDYLAVEALGQISPGLLLLTATPEQLGQLGHFGRLRLLDPDRYHSFDAFKTEEAEYTHVAQLLPATMDELDSKTAGAIRDQLGQYAPVDDNQLVTALLDRHGTGRVLFRNVRESVAGFPERRLVKHKLDHASFPEDPYHWDSKDPRVSWLISLLEDSIEKFLVICARAETAIALERYLREKTIVRSAAFHEGMDLIARDRAANYFADKERGAQVLICSEIGSEGRNFQFAHQLVMFDLPGSPDLLEQRIGRLDRIGQRHDVTIHVPYAPGSRQGLLLEIYDTGLGIFTAPNPTAQAVFDQTVEDQSIDITSGHDQDSAAIAAAVQTLSRDRLAALKQGRDRLVELNSHRPEVSEELLSQMIELGLSKDLENYMEASFTAFGLESEPLSDHLMTVKPSDSMQRHEAVSVETMGRARYPELPEEGTSYTYHRETALAREDVLYLTWESPMVQEALDLVTSDVTGNAVVIVLKLKGVPTGTILTETLHRVECIAPAALGADQYLPPRVIRSLMTPELKDLSDQVPFTAWQQNMDIPQDAISKIVAQQEDGLRGMLAAAESAAAAKFEPMKADADESMRRQLQAEIQRMEALAEVNPNVRQEETQFLREALDALTSAIASSRVALEAVRVIIAA